MTVVDIGSCWDEYGDDVERAILIREFEERILELFSLGELSGTVHTCIGQEFAAVAVARSLGSQDFVFSNHRGHGHFLAMYPDPGGLLAEVMGRRTGVSGGVGGSQHLIGPQFMSNGVQAGLTAIAVGYAAALRRRDVDAIAVAFIGDGTLGEGLLYESLNLSSVLPAPVLFVLEDNGVAQSTDTSTTIGGSIAGRAAAFGLPYFEGSTWDWRDLFVRADEAIRTVRDSGRPALLHIKTFRLMAHSKGDDNRNAAEVDEFRRIDPLLKLRQANSERYDSAVDRMRSTVDRALAEARVAEPSRYEPSRYEPSPPVVQEPLAWRRAATSAGRHADAVHEGIRLAMEQDPRVLLLGEDIEAPYGGAFKITRELSSQFPGRVVNTPISEAAIVGCATGLALGGLVPVAEIMFGDFLTLAFDQLLQHASKLPLMYAESIPIPMVVRAPMGGRRGYGPTHSQSLEKHFLGIPGLVVVAPNLRVDIRSFYRDLIGGLTSPVLIIENKTQYTRFADEAGIPGFEVLISNEFAPTVRISPIGTRADATLVCYGGMLEEAERAQRVLFDRDEIALEIICPTALHPLNMAPVLESVAESGRLVVVEEGPSFAAFGSEVLAQAVEAGLAFAGKRRGYAGILPASASLEAELLVDADDIVGLVRDLCGV